MEQILKYFPELTKKSISQLEMLEPLYNEWNAKINVISRKDMNFFYTHHVLHSLAIAKVFKPAPGSTVLDLGTGGGFPGIPLAIFFPDVKFILCDSIGKKIKVASEIASAIGLQNVEFINSRAEDINGNFDWVVSRAVTGLEKFMPLVNGKYEKGILYLKGSDAEEEICKCSGKYGLQMKKITIFDIKDWFKEDWFEGKKIIFIAR